MSQQQPFNTGQPPDDKKFFNGLNRPSGRWMIFSTVPLVLGGIGLAFYFSSGQDETSKADVKPIGTAVKAEDSVVGGKGTPQYNKMLIEEGAKKAEQATQTGKSYVSTPVGGSGVEELEQSVTGNGGLGGAAKPTAARPQYQPPPPTLQQQQADRDAAANAAQRNEQVARDMAAAMARQMEAISERLKLRPQTVTVYEDRLVGTGPDGKPCGRQDQPPCPRKSGNSVETRDPVAIAEGSEETAGQGASTTKAASRRSPVRPGMLLYAANDIMLSSEGGSMSVARATIVSGDHKGWVLLGSFQAGKESLAIKYQTLVDPDGRDYAVDAYAVSPDTDRAAIATEVDNHNLERWGGLTAAAFLKGFGEITRLSGTQSVGGPLYNQGAGISAMAGYYGGYISQAPHYSLMQKGAVALGEVGNQASQVLAQRFNQPPTVTLAAGAPLGILFVK